MAFVKIDCGILDSTLWIDRDCRDIFLTTLLMAEPYELKEPAEQLHITKLEPTGWAVPAGWYGFVKAAAVGIARRAGIDVKAATAALEKLGSPEAESRSQDFDGRRLVRVDGGFIILNFIKYRERDTTSAERSRRWRQRRQRASTTPQEDQKPTRRSQRVDTLRNGSERRSRHQAEAEVEVEEEAETGEITPVGTKGVVEGVSRPPPAPKAPAVPYDKILAMYNELCPKLIPAKRLTDARRAQLRGRWREHSDLEWWSGYFKYISDKCHFLTGGNEKHWVADFDFVIKEAKMTAIMESKYERQR